MKTKPIMNREQWLTELMGHLEEDFARIEAPVQVAMIRVSIGFPSHRALSLKKRVVGQCWSTESSPGGVSEIFVSPLLNDGLEAGATLAHEMVHAAVGTKAGHKAPFKRVAVKLGLEGKMTSTVPGAELTERLNDLICKVGSYPHMGLNPVLSGVKKQGTRLLKGECPDCGYTIRVTQKWADAGMPVCPCGEEMVLEG
jgi:hypothetical protein